MEDCEAFIDRIEHIRDWIDKGVFWASVEDPAASADLGPLPLSEDMYQDEIEELQGCLDLLQCDLTDDEPDEGTLAHEAWQALTDTTDAYLERLADRWWELEEEIAMGPLE